MAYIGSRRQRAEIDALREKAARLPDATERAVRAEAESAERLHLLNDVSSRYAALQAREEATRVFLNKLNADLSTEQNTVSGLRHELDLSRSRLSDIEANLRSTHSMLTELREQSDGLRSTNDQLNARVAQLSKEVAQAEAQRDAAISLQERTHHFLNEAQSALRVSFTEAASKVFDEKSLSLEKRIADSAVASKDGLQTTLQPFAEIIAKFQQRLETITTENTTARSELSGKIDALVNLNQNMAEAADSLTKALKGNAKIRGDWGEMVLDSVLAASGLKEGINYVRQRSERDEETGNLQRPDVVVLLPEARKVILDSKVSFDAWRDAVNTDDPVLQSAALNRHVSALRTHVNQLAEKNYPALYPGEALEITIAFVPIEAALSKALEISPNLQLEAFRKGIAFATPNTLMAMMQVVERLWIRDKLQTQIDTISDEAGKLLDSVSSFLTEFETLEQHFKKAENQLKGVRSKLETSPQSVLARSRRLIAAGAKGKKKMHALLLSTTESYDALPLLSEASAAASEDQNSDSDEKGPE
jgi:DNA recombination protein RmuC